MLKNNLLIRILAQRFFLITVAAPLIAAASNQKIFSDRLAAASIQERLLIKKQVYSYSEVAFILCTFSLTDLLLIHKTL